MYSSSNNDFVRGTVTDFYEMFKQVSETEEYSAFGFNSTIDGMLSDKVCPLDDMEAALKLRNTAIKQRCSATHIHHLRTILVAVRVIADTIVTMYYILLQIFLGLLRLMVPGIASQASPLHTSFALLFIQGWPLVFHTHKTYTHTCDGSRRSSTSWSSGSRSSSPSPSRPSSSLSTCSSA